MGGFSTNNITDPTYQSKTFKRIKNTFQQLRHNNGQKFD